MGVPEIKRETNVCAVKEWGVNEEIKLSLGSLGMNSGIYSKTPFKVESNNPL